MAPASSSGSASTRDAALDALARAAADNIRGVDFASVTLRDPDDDTLRTVAATDPVAEQIDALQYQLHEGPCYAAVNEQRWVLVDDVAASTDYPRYGPRAAGLGVHSQAAIQLVSDGRRAGLNLYSRTASAFGASTVQVAELFGTHVAAILEYVEQIEQLSEALHTRTDIGTAVGIIMERYRIDRDRAFAFLVRNSTARNVKFRVLAQDVIAGIFQSTAKEDDRAQGWP